MPRIHHLSLGAVPQARQLGLGVHGAALGEQDRAFRYLDEGYGERPSEMMFLKVDPRIDSLRSDPVTRSCCAGWDFPSSSAVMRLAELMGNPAEPEDPCDGLAVVRSRLVRSL